MAEHLGTTCVQGGYRPGDAEPRQVPIYQSTTWKYDTSEHMGRLFDLDESGYFYTRLQNPTTPWRRRSASSRAVPPPCLRAPARLPTSLRSSTSSVRATMWWQAPPSMAARTTLSPTPWGAWASRARSSRPIAPMRSSRRRSVPTRRRCSGRPLPTLRSTCSISSASLRPPMPMVCRSSWTTPSRRPCSAAPSSGGPIS